MHRDLLPLRLLDQDPRRGELRRVHAVIPVEMRLHERVDVREREPPVGEVLLDRLDVHDVLEGLAREHERSLASDPRLEVVGAAACVDEDVPPVALEEPRDVRDVDLLAEVVHVREAALLPLRAVGDDHRRDRVHGHLSFLRQVVWIMARDELGRQGEPLDAGAERSEGVGDGARDRGRGRDQARLAHPLDAAGRERRRGRAVGDFDRRHLGGGGQQVVHQRGGLRLAARRRRRPARAALHRHLARARRGSGRRRSAG